MEEIPMNLDKEMKERLLSSNSCYMLGKLAVDEASFPPVGDENKPVTIMKNSDFIVFFVKALSVEPDPVIEYLDVLRSPLYIGLETDNNDIKDTKIPLDYKYNCTIQQKIEMWKDNLKDKMIVFKPKIKITEDKNHKEKSNIFKNLEIVKIISDSDISDDDQYLPIPKVNIENALFEKKLVEDETLEFSDYNHARKSPRYILCGNYLYHKEDAWRKHNDTENAWKCDCAKVKKLELSDEIERIPCTDSLVFIKQKDIDRCKDIFKSQGKSIDPDVESFEDSYEESNIADTSELSEENFLEAFIRYASVKEKLCYEERDLINLHICAKTNPLTILAGMSGTGKTQLAIAYAKMLGLSEDDKTLLFLPINPSYTEPGDLIGYFNNINNRFTPSETGLTDVLIHAKRHPEKMHMVVFDEMNLSQVEYWFAPFISLLEKKAEERKLSLYSPTVHCENSKDYESSIKIGTNIIFIGTVNLDETTKEFSDRLLDRANLIFLNKQSFHRYYEEQKNRKDEGPSYENFICSSYDDFSNWISSDDPLESFRPEDMSFFDGLHDLIQMFDSQKGVSFRALRKTGEYLNNIPFQSGENRMSREDAFDLAVKQRIITKIKGARSQFGSLIGTVADKDTPTDSLLYDFFCSAEARDISHFSETKKEITRKARELDAYGYTS